MERTMSRYKSYHFTLIEMLVVIAIISILAATLMPSLRKAIDSAQGVACQNNQHQSWVGVNIFMGDHNSLLFVDWEYQGGKLRFWHEGLLGQVTINKKFFSPLVSDRRVLACPITTNDVGYPPFTGNDLLYYGSRGYYGANAWLWSKNPQARSIIDEGNHYKHHYLRLGSIPTPATQMFLLDNRMGRLYYTNSGKDFPGIGQQTTECVPNFFQNNNYPRAIWLGHNNGANVLYLDGHASHRDVIQLNEAGATSFIDANFDKLTFP